MVDLDVFLVAVGVTVAVRANRISLPDASEPMNTSWGLKAGLAHASTVDGSRA